VSILDFIGAEGLGDGGDNWSYETCKAPVTINKTPGFLTGRVSFLSPNQQRQSTEGNVTNVHV